MLSANSLMHVGLQIAFVCLYITPSHYHHCAHLSEDNEQNDNDKMSVIYILSSVWVRLSIFSDLSAMHMGFTHFPIDWMYTYVFYYHHQIGSIYYHPLFSHETMVSAVCFFILFWILRPSLKSKPFVINLERLIITKMYIQILQIYDN